MLPRIRVLDLTNESGHLAGKILGDMGADVVKVEPRGGDPLRKRGPFAPGCEGRPDASLPFLALNTSKRSIEIDLTSEVGRAEFLGLVDDADVLLETFAPGELDALGLGADFLHARNPALVHCSITPFGQTGPYAHYRGGDLIAVSMGGNAGMTGQPELAPVRCSVPLSYFHAAPEAALGIAIALYARDRSGRGQFVDVSLQECQLATLITGVGQHALNPQPRKRMGAMLGRTREIWRTSDGWVSFGLRGGPSRVPNLVATVEYMAETGMAPQWLCDYEWANYSTISVSNEELSRLEEVFGAFFATRTMAELYSEALSRRILLAPCNDAREIHRQAQLRDRSLFEKRSYPDLGIEIEHPAFFAKSSRGGIGIRSNAPALDAHRAEVLAGWNGEAAMKAPPSPETGAADTRGIFEGLRVLELGAGAAGPIATEYFAQLGAEVVRIESEKRPDFLRMLHVTADNRNEPEILDKAPMFALLNTNKKSVAINMKSDEGIELVKRLVAWADIVSENFAPGVMERWGLDYESLRPLNSRLVMASGCLFGQTGPQRSYPGFGGQGAAISGFNHLTGRPDSEAHGPFGTVTDSLAPRYVALCLTAALIERDRTGKGQYLDVSQIETGVYSASEVIVRYSATGEIMQRQGNASECDAPHGIYPCAGDDRWIAIAIRSDDEWRSLQAEGDEADWWSDPRFVALEGRLAKREELDERIADWTRDFDAHELMARLQRAGLEAGVVQSYDELLADPQLAARGHFVELEHPDLGRLVVEQPGFRLARASGVFESAGPKLGEHTRPVLSGELGLAEEEIEALVAADVLV